MSMKNYLALYLLTGAIFLAIDAIWLGTMSSRFYKPLLGDLLAKDVSLAPAILFYLIYVVGMLVFAVLPAVAASNWTSAMASGALLGLVAYATYDLTNQSTMRGWPTIVTVADLAWGTFVTAVSSAAATRLWLWWSAR